MFIGMENLGVRNWTGLLMELMEGGDRVTSEGDSGKSALLCF